MKKLIFSIAAATVVLSFSCTRSNSGSKPDLYKRSELAFLMRGMWDENLAVKSAILDGSDSIRLTTNYHKINTSQPTDSNDLTPVFYRLASNYQTLADSFSAASSNAQKRLRYNATIDGCISCHENFCTGPINKIKTLYLPQ